MSNSYNIVIRRRRRAIWTSPEITFTVCLFAPQITLYLGKRDFVDHVDSVEVVGMSCSMYALKHGSCAWPDGTVFLLMCRGRRQSGPFQPEGQERYLNPKPPLNAVTAGTLKMSPSLQSTSTSPAPSATEAKTWTWWVYPSGGTSGSSASRCTRPRGRTRLRPRCRNSSWGRAENRDMLFPFRSGNITFLWLCIRIPSYAKAFFFHLF